MATTEALLTAEEYLRLPDMGRPTELVRGKVVMMNAPGAPHGWMCAQISQRLTNFVQEHNLGFVLSNDSGVVTQRGPDTVRGADISFYSYDRLPELKEGYPAQSPDMVFEVRSPSDRWKDVLQKVAEYLTAGVRCVCVVDLKQEAVVIYSPDAPGQTLTGEHSLTFPDILPGFSLPVAQLFEQRR